MVAVVCIVFFVTFNLAVTLLTVFAVILVDFYLVALMYYWGLTLNMFTGLNMIFALGLAVDYSSHIAHSFLMAQPPPSCVTESQKRHYKARIALSQMGSSVIHGGTSTFISILMLGFAESYVFTTFFKTWVGIIIFGISNGFLLMPIILATCGPLIEPDLEENAEGANSTLNEETNN